MNWAEPKIDVRIAFEPEGKLGADYNRIMEEASTEWVLFLDHDFMLMHPSWYLVCQQAIRQKPDAGIFTTYCNTGAKWTQRLKSAPRNLRPIIEHKRFARRIWDQNRYSLSEIKGRPISGYFMLTSRTAWRKAGGFRGTGFFGEDTEYHRRLIRAGLTVWRINGLYGFHLRDRSASWIRGVNTAKEYWEAYVARQREKGK